MNLLTWSTERESFTNVQASQRVRVSSTWPSVDASNVFVPIASLSSLSPSSSSWCPQLVWWWCDSKTVMSANCPQKQAKNRLVECCYVSKSIPRRVLLVRNRQMSDFPKAAPIFSASREYLVLVKVFFNDLPMKDLKMLTKLWHCDMS